MDSPVRTDAPPLIPRQVFLGNPDKASPQISPDGAWLGWLAPVDGVLNVWAAPAERPAEARPVTRDTGRGVRMYSWTYSRARIVYLQDSDGDENWHVYTVDLDSGEIRDLTPIEGVRAEVQQVSPQHPQHLLVGLNDRDPRFHDIHRIDLATGERTLVQLNEQFSWFVTDDGFNLRFGVRQTPDGGSEYLQKTGDNEWASMFSIGMEDAMTTWPMGFDRSGRVLYMTDSRGRNTAVLKSLDLDAGAETLLAADPRSDAGGVMVHPTEKTIQAVSFNYERKSWKVLDESIAADLEYLETVAPGEIEVVSRTLDDSCWIVAYLLDDGPVRYYRYLRGRREARFLFTNRGALEGLPLVKMHPAVIPSRDGLDLVCYYSLPRETDPDGSGRPARPAPMVLMVHGGPWGRDAWGYDPGFQLLANRGYAVLSVNFRGSTGFGKEFVNAANHEWAGRMHDDLIDAVKLGRRPGYRRPGAGGGDGRQLRRLRHPGRHDLHAGDLRLRRRHRRPFQPGHPARVHTALLGAPGRPVRKPRRGPPDRRGPGVPAAAVAPDVRRPHPPPPADRPGGKRSQGEAVGVGPDRAGDAGEGDPGDLRPLPGRGPRVRPSGEQPFLLRGDRGFPGELPGRPLRAGRGRPGRFLDIRPGRGGVRAGAAGGVGPDRRSVSGLPERGNPGRAEESNWRANCI